MDGESGNYGGYTTGSSENATTYAQVAAAQAAYSSSNPSSGVTAQQTYAAQLANYNTQLAAYNANGGMVDIGDGMTPMAKPIAPVDPNQSNAETARLAAQNAGAMGLGNISPGSLPSQDKSNFSFFDSAKNWITNIGHVAVLSTPFTTPLAKANSALSLGGSISDTFSGLTPDANSSYDAGGDTTGAVSRGNSGGNASSGFSLSPGNAAPVNISSSSSGGLNLAGPASTITAAEVAPNFSALDLGAKYAPSLDATTASTATGGSLQAVAPTQKTESQSLLATLAALASIFALLKS